MKLSILFFSFLFSFAAFSSPMICDELNSHDEPEKLFIFPESKEVISLDGIMVELNVEKFDFPRCPLCYEVAGNFSLELFGETIVVDVDLSVRNTKATGEMTIEGMNETFEYACRLADKKDLALIGR